MELIKNAIFTLLLTIDSGIYWASALVYRLLINIANGTVFTQENIEAFSGKIYALLGIFMIFKVTFSLINYIINPDDFTDSNKGVGNLVQKILTTLVLVVFVPLIFQYAMVAQQYILEEQVLDNLIFGESAKSVNKNNNNGDVIAADLFGTFFYYTVDPYPGVKDENGNDIIKAVPVGENKAIYRYTTLQNAFYNDDYGAIHGMWTNDNYHYTVLLSTAAGVVLLLVLVQFCFDIAIRTVKFAFLQIIAPIPIISRIDPKSDKNSKFDKWVSTCFKTYLDLFIRLLALYFAIYAINMIRDSGLFTSGEDGLLVKAMLILGTLMFAKDLPKLLEELFGFKLGGDFTLNPMKRLNKVPGAAMIGGAVGGGLAGMAANGYAAIRNNKGKGFKGALKGTGSAIAGLGGGFVRGAASGLGKNKNNIYGAMQQGLKGTAAARNLHAERQVAGDDGIKGVIRRTRVAINNAAGITSGAERYEKELSAYDSYLSKQAAIDKLIDGEITKGKSSRSTTFEWKDVNGTTIKATENVNVLKQQYESLKNSGGSAIDIQNAEYKYQAALKKAKKDYVNFSYDLDSNGNPKEITMDTHIAEQVRHMIDDMDYFAQQNSSYQGLANRNLSTASNIGDAWDSAKGQMFGEKDRVTSSDEYRQAMVNKKMDQKK